MTKILADQKNTDCMNIQVHSIFVEQVRLCQNALFAIANAMLRNEHDAMDAVQDAIMHGWMKRSTLRDSRCFSAWMARILINVCRNNMRRKRPTVELYDIPSIPQPLDEALDIRKAINKLDEKTRICTVLFYFEDMPVLAIAKLLNLSEGTVKSRLHRARKQLRSHLEVE